MIGRGGSGLGGVGERVVGFVLGAAVFCEVKVIAHGWWSPRVSH